MCAARGRVVMNGGGCPLRLTEVDAEQVVFCAVVERVAVGRVNGRVREGNVRVGLGPVGVDGRRQRAELGVHAARSRAPALRALEGEDLRSARKRHSEEAALRVREEGDELRGQHAGRGQSRRAVLAETVPHEHWGRAVDHVHHDVIFDHHRLRRAARVKCEGQRLRGEQRGGVGVEAGKGDQPHLDGDVLVFHLVTRRHVHAHGRCLATCHTGSRGFECRSQQCAVVYESCGPGGSLQHDSVDEQAEQPVAGTQLRVCTNSSLITANSVASATPQSDRRSATDRIVSM